MGSSTGRAYYSRTYYDVVTVAGWSNSDTEDGHCLTTARVWSHSAEVVDYFYDAHPTTWGDDAVAESALVTEAVSKIDFGTPYDWQMQPIDPASDESNITVSFSFPIVYGGYGSLGISFPISGVDVTLRREAVHEMRKYLAWKKQRNCGYLPRSSVGWRLTANGKHKPAEEVHPEKAIPDRCFWGASR